VNSIKRSLLKRNATKAVEKMTNEAGNAVTEDMFSHQVTQQTKKIFGQLVCDPRSATVKYQGRDGDRYIFLATKGLSVDFFQIVQQFFGVPDEVSRTRPFSLSFSVITSSVV
jgi:hypothetical protein